MAFASRLLFAVLITVGFEPVKIIKLMAINFGNDDSYMPKLSHNKLIINCCVSLTDITLRVGHLQCYF